MKLISVTAFILSYLLIDGIANSHPMGGLLEEAIDQVDNDIFFETENYRQQYGDGDDDGLTGEGGPDIMNGSQLLVANEEDNITRNVSRTSSKSFKSTKTYNSYKLSRQRNKDQATSMKKGLYDDYYDYPYTYVCCEGACEVAEVKVGK